VAGNSEFITTLEHPILRPSPGVPWAETMVLNPAVIDEPGTDRLHMLFRASGPGQSTGGPAPYPIYLGYASSDDGGTTWQVDWSRPALAPALQTAPDKIVIRNRQGHWVTNHANGCVEDPRLFRLGGRLYCTTACRMFPPGPYWEKDDPMQCAPAWARGTNTLGRAASENVTVSVLWEVDLEALATDRYEEAFAYVTHLTDPELGDNRDVMLFPTTVEQGGRLVFLCLHRPAHPASYGAEFEGLKPSIFVAAARRLEDFPTALARHRLLALPEFWWEANRIGASWGPLTLADGSWLLPYHGKLDELTGYTQSFMILGMDREGWPRIQHRCPERMMQAVQPWEKEGLFRTPCVFTCGGVPLPDGRLLMTYGAADTVAGAAWADLGGLVDRIRHYGPDGKVGDHEAKSISTP
jgi:predicted GH43/DUF377 family glycosyl hydrolase